MILVQERRFPVARHIAWLLLEHRDGLVLDSWAAYWLGELADTIDDLAERARFTGWLESFVRAIHGHARNRNQPSATAEEARRALVLATEFTFTICLRSSRTSASVGWPRSLTLASNS